MEKSLEEQGPFDLILHKMTALYALALHHHEDAQKMVERFENYAKAHPSTLLMDPLEGVCCLLHRNKTYTLLKHVMCNDELVLTPSYCVLLDTQNEEATDQQLQESNITFPVVCKPLSAGGGREAHQMAVVMCRRRLREVPVPCVAQSFINHGAVLYKLYVLGNKWFVVVRPSLKNFYAGDQETIFFNSHQVSKADSCSPLSQLDPEDQTDLPKADPAVFNRIVRQLRAALQMDLLGIDVVIDCQSGKYAVIDVNAFPSFDSVPNVMESLADLILSHLEGKVDQKLNCIDGGTGSNYVTDLDDSGIETADSSDEKKKTGSVEASVLEGSRILPTPNKVSSLLSPMSSISSAPPTVPPDELASSPVATTSALNSRPCIYNPTSTLSDCIPSSSNCISVSSNHTSAHSQTAHIPHLDTELMNGSVMDMTMKINCSDDMWTERMGDKHDPFIIDDKWKSPPKTENSVQGVTSKYTGNSNSK
ncbi:inositol-tetrakisphosphate 1-kinase-like isoform X2 [Oratosquilla oratoria]